MTSSPLRWPVWPDLYLVGYYQTCDISFPGNHQLSLTDWLESSPTRPINDRWLADEARLWKPIRSLFWPSADMSAFVVPPRQQSVGSEINPAIKPLFVRWLVNRYNEYSPVWHIVSWDETDGRRLRLISVKIRRSGDGLVCGTIEEATIVNSEMEIHLCSPGVGGEHKMSFGCSWCELFIELSILLPNFIYYEISRHQIFYVWVK